MKITKYGHCCLLIEVVGKRILTDPGKFSGGFEDLTEIDVVVISHEHADHFHTEAVIHILEQNPQAIVVANGSVAKLLKEVGIDAHILEGDRKEECGGVSLHAFDGTHAEIYKEYGQVQNTGYMIDDTLFYPGDAYIVPKTPVDTLLLPVAGPWCKVSEALEYALKVHPQRAIPVHDAVLSEAGKGVVYGFFSQQLGGEEIEFIPLIDGVAKEL